MPHLIDVRSDIMGRITSTLHHMTESHNKVLAVRFDVRFPTGFSQKIHGNRLISLFIARLADSYAYRGIDFKYVWVREVVGSDHPHYHFMVTIDGSKIQSPYTVFQDAERIWGNVLNLDATGLIDHCRHEHDGQPGVNGIMVRRPSSLASGDELIAQQQAYDEALQYALYRGTYLAKTFSKGHAPHRVREFGSSRF